MTFGPYGKASLRSPYLESLLGGLWLTLIFLRNLFILGRVL